MQLEPENRIEEIADTLSEIPGAQRIIESMPECIQVVSSRGMILYSNRGDMGAVGENIDERIFSEDMVGLQREMKVRCVGEVFETEVRVRVKEWRWMLVRGTKYELDNRKKTRCFVVSFREVERREVVFEGVGGSEDVWGRVSGDGLVLRVLTERGKEMEGERIVQGGMLGHAMILHQSATESLVVGDEEFECSVYPLGKDDFLFHLTRGNEDVRVKVSDLKDSMASLLHHSRHVNRLVSHELTKIIL